MKSNGAFVIPAYNPGPLLRDVVTSLRAKLRLAELSLAPIVVIDDGCTDGATDGLPSDVIVLRHERNLGKGAALQTGLRWAHDQRLSYVVSLDADGQHPSAEAIRLYVCSAPKGALVLAVRDLAKAGAPRPNQLSNAFSNWILSLFGGTKLQDTQCGLRRYPVMETLRLGAKHRGYAFESDVVLRAARTGLPIVHTDAEVLYPRGLARVSHFDSFHDPIKNVVQVITTTWQVPHHRPLRRWVRRGLIALALAALLWKLARIL